MIGFSFFCFQTKGSAVWTASFWIVGFPERNLSDIFSLTYRTEPYLGGDGGSLTKEYLGQNAGTGHQASSSQISLPPQGSPRHPQPNEGSEPSHQFTRHNSLCRLIKMLSEEKKTNYPTALFFVVILFEITMKSSLCLTLGPNPLFLSTFHLAEPVPPTTLGLTHPINLAGTQ